MGNIIRVEDLEGIIYRLSVTQRFYGDKQKNLMKASDKANELSLVQRKQYIFNQILDAITAVDPYQIPVSNGKFLSSKKVISIYVSKKALDLAIDEDLLTVAIENLIDGLPMMDKKYFDIAKNSSLFESVNKRIVDEYYKKMKKPEKLNIEKEARFIVQSTATRVNATDKNVGDFSYVASNDNVIDINSSTKGLKYRSIVKACKNSKKISLKQTYRELATRLKEATVSEYSDLKAEFESYTTYELSRIENEYGKIEGSEAGTLVFELKMITKKLCSIRASKVLFSRIKDFISTKDFDKEFTSLLDAEMEELVKESENINSRIIVIKNRLKTLKEKNIEKQEKLEKKLEKERLESEGIIKPVPSLEPVTPVKDRKQQLYDKYLAYRDMINNVVMSGCDTKAIPTLVFMESRNRNENESFEQIMSGMDQMREFLGINSLIDRMVRRAKNEISENNQFESNGLSTLENKLIEVMEKELGTNKDLNPILRSELEYYLSRIKFAQFHITPIKNRKDVYDDGGFEEAITDIKYRDYLTTNLGDIVKIKQLNHQLI